MNYYQSHGIVLAVYVNRVNLDNFDIVFQYKRVHCKFCRPGNCQINER